MLQKLDPQTTALVLIDLQQGILDLRRNVAEPPRAVTPIASSKQALPAARSIFDRSVIFFEAVETIEEIQRLSAGESGRTRARCADTGCSSSTTTIAS
jgi:nicotinamidase-related amidase